MIKRNDFNFGILVEGTYSIAQESGAIYINSDMIGSGLTYSGGILEATGGGGGTSSNSYYGQIVRVDSGTISIATSSVYQSTGLTASLEPESFGMSLATSNDFGIKNTSGETILFLIEAQIDIECSANQELGMKLAINGNPVDKTETLGITEMVGLTDIITLKTSYLIELDDDDEVSIFVRNFTSDDDINLLKGKIIAITPAGQGAVGATGPQGAVGATGSQGAVGATGPQGLTTISYYGQISKQTTTTISIATASTYQVLGFTGSLDSQVSGFTSSASNFGLKNISGETILVEVFGSADVNAGNNHILGIKLALNGVLINQTECRAVSGASVNFAKLVTKWMIELDDQDEIDLFVANFTSTGNVDVDRARLVISTLGGTSLEASVDFQQVAFGSTPSGLTSSSEFTFEKTLSNFITGLNHNITGLTTRSSILGGDCNRIGTQSNHATIVGGQNNTIDYYSSNSAILGGYSNFIYYSTYGSISGVANALIDSPSSGIKSSFCGLIQSSQRSGIIGGDNNSIFTSGKSIVMGGLNNSLDGSERSAIINGCCNQIECNSFNSVIIGGGNNTISGSTQSAIIGASNLTLNNQNQTTFARNFWIAGSMSPNSGVNFGVSATFSVGSSVVTVCNGIIISIV
jgi:hypothetical protein